MTAFCATVLGSCALLTPLPPARSIDERLAAFGALKTPGLSGAVTVHWNDHLVPFIEAGSDGDAAYTLGLVHGHLRLGQMEMAKRVAYGRISEMVGFVATDIDEALRTWGPGRGIEEILARMPPASRAWLERYVAGVNAYKAQMTALPHVMRVLGMDNEPWRLEDSMMLGRLSGADVNWFTLYRLLPEVDKAHWREIWGQLEASQDGITASFGAAAQEAGVFSPGASRRDVVGFVARWAAGFVRSGSNAFAVAGHRSESGAPLIANDPHLGFMIPNFWMIAGLKSPSYHLVGMVPPGMPIFAFGRNAHLAWGGTNMRQQASDFVDVTGLEFDREVHTIKRRWIWDTRRTVRVHRRYGPVVSDAREVPFPEGLDIALRWTGHLPSDEVSAMLGVAKARGFQEMLEALRGFSVPGQNFIVATQEGDIGHILGTWIPRRDVGFPEGLWVSPEESDRSWAVILRPDTLPHQLNPAEGFVASANNKPFENGPDGEGNGGAGVQINWFFGSDDRIRRIQSLLSGEAKLDIEAMQRFQLDSYSLSHEALHAALMAQRGEAGLSAKTRRVLEGLRAWDGFYARDSREALWMHRSYLALAAELYGEKESARLLSRLGFLPRVLSEDLKAMTQERRVALLEAALGPLAAGLDDGQVWGDVHRLRVMPVLGNLPVLGWRYRQGDVRVGGHNHTVFRTSGAWRAGTHTVNYGAQSRHVSDLGDIDSNHFVLFGGQDGEIGTANALDQVPLWAEGRYIQIPFRLERVRTLLPRRTVLRP